MATVLALMIGRMGDVAVLGARAQATADLVALAAVDGGREEAARVARANQATVVDLSSDGSHVAVVIVRAGQRASAHAEAGDADGSGPGT